MSFLSSRGGESSPIPEFASLAILKAIGAGYHALKANSIDSLVSTTNLSAYLQTLRDLRPVERRLPATIRPSKQRTPRRGRHHLTDLYFRFRDPQQEDLEYDGARMLDYIRDGLRAFPLAGMHAHVGRTAFEALAHRWVRQRGKAGSGRPAP